MSPISASLAPPSNVRLMGIVNATPDSFSDGGKFTSDDSIVRHALQLIDDGANIIDIGAESTRPGANPVDARDQIQRLGRSISILAAAGHFVSIDTTSPEVATFAIDEGARLINSVSLEPAAQLGALAAARGVGLALMHSRGNMREMAGFSVYPDEAYRDVVADVKADLLDACKRALEAGLSPADLMVDPGLGFAKNASQSMALCTRLGELCELGYPVLVGPSRKSFVGIAAARDGKPSPPNERLGGTIAACLWCVQAGASVLRIHDVASVRQALAFTAAAHRAPQTPVSGHV